MSGRDDLTLADMQDGEQDDHEMGRAPANRMPAPKRHPREPQVRDLEEERDAARAAQDGL